jgi:hypothetical protein
VLEVVAQFGDVAIAEVFSRLGGDGLANRFLEGAALELPVLNASQIARRVTPSRLASE